MYERVVSASTGCFDLMSRRRSPSINSVTMNMSLKVSIEVGGTSALREMMFGCSKSWSSRISRSTFFAVP